MRPNRIYFFFHTTALGERKPWKNSINSKLWSTKLTVWQRRSLYTPATDVGILTVILSGKEQRCSTPYWSQFSRKCLYTQQWYMSYRFADSLRAGSGRKWFRPDPARKLSAHIPLLCVQWKTPDDGQRNGPKHVEFYSKNKFEKLVHLVGLVIRIYHDARSPERQNPWLLFCVIYYNIARNNGCVDDRLVCRLTCIPHGHLHRVT